MLNPARESRRHFLENPAISVGVCERGEGTIAEPQRMWARGRGDGITLRLLIAHVEVLYLQTVFPA